MLSIKNLNFSYKEHVNVLRDISLSVEDKAIFFLIGANGSGKSTLLKSILGLVEPDNGYVEINNIEMNRQNRLPLMHHVGVFLENASFYGHLSVRENIGLVGSYYKVKQEQIDEVLDILNLETVSKSKAGTLSTGYKQRLGLAISLVHKPKIVFLDEPTNGLDPQSIISFREIILKLNQTLGVTFFITTHLLAEVERLATEVSIIRQGTLIDTFKMTELALSAIGSNNVNTHFSNLEHYYLNKCAEYDKTCTT